MATKYPLDGSEPPVNIGGRPPALKPEHIAVLHDIVTERAQASLQEIADELYQRCGVRVCDATIRRTLHAQGIVRLKPKRKAFATASKAPSGMATRQRIGAKMFPPTVPI
jgi:transposase